jgi:hypothetical protein
MALGSGLTRLGGYPFEVRYSYGSLLRARAAADVAENAYVYFSRPFSGIEPDIAVIVADEADSESRQPYGLPFFNDDEGQIRPGIVVIDPGLPGTAVSPKGTQVGHSPPWLIATGVPMQPARRDRNGRE